MSVHDYGTGEAPTGPTWTTEQLTTEFIVHGFLAPYVSVTRRSDNQRGTLQFQHRPRVYWGFVADD